MIPGNRTIARATALIVLSACSFGSLTTLTLLVTRAGLPLLPAMMWRYSLAAMVLLLIARKRIPASNVTRGQAARLMLIGGCGQAVITYLSMLALDYLPVAPLAFLFYTYPAWVAVMAAMTGREELTISRFIVLSIAMAGITLMVGTPFSASLNATGVMLALGTAVLYALYLPALHSVQEGIPPIVASFYLVSGVCLSFVIAGALTGSLELPKTLQIWALLTILALVGTVLAFLSLIAGLSVLGPVRTSIIATTEPFFTALLGVVFLGESLTTTMLAGGAMIATAVLLLQWMGRVKADPKPAV
jgi:drug/metabolite transporter (DMT)-like permease